MQTKILDGYQGEAIQAALDVFSTGGLVVFPTDTVYGLAAPIWNGESINRIYRVKGRSVEKAIPVLLGNTGQLVEVALEINQAAHILARRFWPGPLTLIVPRRPDLPESLSPYPTVGVRIPNHPVALALLQASGPLATTSANISGHLSPTTAQSVMAELDGLVELVLDGGETPGGVPSTVVNVTGVHPAILRHGPISEAQIQAALGLTVG